MSALTEDGLRIELELFIERADQASYEYQRVIIDELLKFVKTEIEEHEVEGGVNALIIYAKAIEESSNPDAIVKLDSVAAALRRSAARIKQNHEDTKTLAEMIGDGS